MPEDEMNAQRHHADKLKKLGTLQYFLDNLNHPPAVLACIVNQEKQEDAEQ